VNHATRRSYDLVAARYAAEIGDELAGKPLDRAVLNAFAKLSSGLVIDVGAGPGHVAGYLAQQGVSLVVTDLSPVMCGLARRAGLPAVAADMTALPFDAGVAGGVLCLYAVIHLDVEQRASAYASFARVLRPGGLALVAFHTSDADVPVGGEKLMSSWWGSSIELTFRFLDPRCERDALIAAGFESVAVLDRAPGPNEHPSQRSYLLMRKRHDS
jgi:SAM-dependent methyltransferase